MKLLIEELKENDLTQNLSYSLEQRVQLGAIIPYLYMHNAPSGDFFFEIAKNNGEFNYIKQFNSNDIKTALNTTDNFAHVFFPIVPETPIFLEKGDYSLWLWAENYVYNRNSFIGWIRQHENLNNSLSNTPSNDAENPLAFRLKVFKGGLT
jgi:hypothetical protein